MKKIWLSLFLIQMLLLFPSLVFSQKKSKIKLKNPSFERNSRPSMTPKGWKDCSRENFPKESIADVLPRISNKGPLFGVDEKPKHGETYLGLVVRENGSWESIAQKLQKPLLAGQCYQFSIYLRRARTFQSRLRGGNERIVNFVTPAVLKIFGGNNYCEQGQVLAVSSWVTESDWTKYEFIFKPKEDFNYIFLQAAFQSESISYYNGNILLDKSSSIKIVSCDLNVDSVFLKKKDTLNLGKIEDDLDRYKLIQHNGNYIQFKNNKLTYDSFNNIENIISTMENLENQMLMINFKGLIGDGFEKRKKELEFIFSFKQFPYTKYKILNNVKKIDKVNWLVNKTDFSIGILKVTPN